MVELGLRVVRRIPGDADLAMLLEQSLAELRDRHGPQAGSPVADGAQYYVAYQMDRAVACAALMTIGADLVELKRMYVPAAFRGRGIARELLSCLETLVLSLDIDRLRLQTGTRQPEAVSLYEGSGYQRVQPWGKYAKDSNALCFEKRLG